MSAARPGGGAAARGDQVGVLGAEQRRARLRASPEELRPPRLLLPPRRRAARRAAGAGLPRGAPSPSGSLPAREALQGEPRRLRGGAGGARALHSPPFRPGRGVRAAAPPREALDRSVSWGPAKRGERQAGRNAARPGRGTQGAQRERASRRRRGRGVGSRSARRPNRWDRRGQRRLSPVRRGLQGRGPCGAGAERRLRFVKPQHVLDRLAKANSGSLLRPQSWRRHIFFIL